MTRLLITAIAVTTALAMVGCRGDSDKGEGVATAGGTPTTSATGNNSNSGDIAEQMRRYASCMREHGIDMPDPEVDSEGRTKVQIGEAPEAGGGPAPDREKFEAAERECRQYMPNGGDPPKLDPEQVEQARQFAKCMRENGVPNFPDPEPDGGVRIDAGPGTGINPESQTFKDAESKCEQFMPRGGPGSRRSQGGGS